MTPRRPTGTCSAGAGDDDLVVVHVLHPPGRAEERGDGRRHEHLALPHAHDERAAAPGGDEDAGAVAVGDGEREVAVEARVRGADGLDQVARVALLDQVRDHLGVGVGVVLVPRVGELAPERRVVLDDAVVDDGHARALAGLDRVRVGLDDAAVRGPAGVRQAGRRRVGRGPTASRSADTLPTRRTMSTWPFMRQMPAESYPRYSSRSRPCRRSSLQGRDPTYPTIPHIRQSLRFQRQRRLKDGRTAVRIRSHPAPRP